MSTELGCNSLSGDKITAVLRKCSEVKTCFDASSGPCLGSRGTRVRFAKSRADEKRLGKRSMSPAQAFAAFVFQKPEISPANFKGGLGESWRSLSQRSHSASSNRKTCLLAMPGQLPSVQTCCLCLPGLRPGTTLRSILDQNCCDSELGFLALAVAEWPCLC